MSALLIAGNGGHAVIHFRERSQLIEIWKAGRFGSCRTDYRITRNPKQARVRADQLLAFWGMNIPAARSAP